MNPLEEFHDELRSTCRRLFAPGGPAHNDAAPEQVWSSIVDSGLNALEIPEELGGAGASFAEVAVVLRELGRAVSSAPYLGPTLTVSALLTAERTPERDELLRQIAAGRCRVALALPAASADPAFVITIGSRSPLLLNGELDVVLDAGSADTVVAIASGPASAALVRVPRDAPGLEITATPLVDSSRDVSTVRANNVEIEPSDALGVTADVDALIVQLQARAAIAVACDSLGLGEAMLDATVAYTAQREQFGRPIGSFQAVKHAVADILVRLTIGGELLDQSIDDLCCGPSDGTSASMAKAFLGRCGVDVAGKAMQLHGGIGYTWEAGIHVYLKRAALNRALFGSTDFHLGHIADRYDLPTSRPQARPTDLQRRRRATNA